MAIPPYRTCRALPTRSSTTGSRAFRRSTPGSAADVRGGRRHPILEGHQSAVRRLVRPVRQRPNGTQVCHRPLRGQDQRRRRRAAESRYDAVNTANRSWTDANTELLPRLRPGQLRAERRVRGHQRPELRQENPDALQWCDEVRTAGAYATTTGNSSTEMQHEVTRGLSVNGGYYFNTGGYFRNTDSAQRVDQQLNWSRLTTSISSASRRRATRGCPTAVATRFAASRPSSPAPSGSRARS